MTTDASGARPLAHNLMEVRNLVKHFRQRGGLFSGSDTVVRAVDGVSLSIENRRTLGLVGESGCGKTTLARCILRLVEPTAGEVSFEGLDLLTLSGRQMREMRREMQIVFQNPFSSLDPRMPVTRLVEEPLLTHGNVTRDQAHDQVVELLHKVGLSSEHLYRYPHELSGGQLQRVAIARALILHPRFMVLDEPTAALDVSVQAQIISLLMALQRELSLTYLFITHNLTLVHYVSDTIAVLYMGRVVEHASAVELFENPLHPYTRVLLSSTPALDPRLRKQRIVPKGEVADVDSLSRGCAFYPRCARAERACRSEVPMLLDVGAGHTVACHLYGRPGCAADDR